MDYIYNSQRHLHLPLTHKTNNMKNQMTETEINYDYINALVEIEQKKAEYEMGHPLPTIAQTFIELGQKRGIAIDIEYGISKNTVGYFITAYDKRLFLPDLWVEDNSPSNVAMAKQWFENMLNKLSSPNTQNK